VLIYERVLSIIGLLVDARQRGVAMVGEIPSGSPHLGWPDMSAGDASRMAATAASIAVVILAQSAAVSRSFALKNQYPVNINQDIAGLALANLGSAMTGGFAINGSPPRTAAGDDARSASQLVNLVMAAVVALVLLCLTGVFKYVPSPVLDGIVFTIGLLLIKVGPLKKVLKASKVEFAVAILTLIAVTFVGVERGLLLAIVVSLMDRLRRQYHPHSDVLVSDGVVAARLAPRFVLHGKAPNDVFVYRFSAPLFFENATFFGEDVRRCMGLASDPIHALVIDCAAMADVDFTGAQTLINLGSELALSGQVLVLTELSEDALRMIRATGADAHLRIVAGIEDAVLTRIDSTS
jgi:sulfate permease, SulP family